MATWATTVSPPAPSTPSVAGGRTTAAVSAVAALLDSAGGDLLPSFRERAVAVLAAFASSGAACRFLAEEAGAVVPHLCRALESGGTGVEHACAALLPLTAASRDASAAGAARGGVAAAATRGRLPPRARREDRGRAAAKVPLLTRATAPSWCANSARISASVIGERGRCTPAQETTSPPPTEGPRPAPPPAGQKAPRPPPRCVACGCWASAGVQGRRSTAQRALSASSAAGKKKQGRGVISFA
ncbi:skin secretory protein xP2-like [Panicum virgatum]|uniref:skin secretory protein xP2-like n=1 Tax=Panicum virgatum TaxID=38727 RepID=UPI0019D57F6D|nr:skin secretory protein xP2-like [Panicum virgatum]